jgi:hypothetical protein
MGRGWRRHEWSQPVDMKRQTNTAGGGIFGCQFRLAQAAGVSSPIQINTDDSYNPSLSERQDEPKNN